MANPYDGGPTGKITYRQLAQHILSMSDEQLDSDVTVEIGWESECYAAELRICDINHDSLDEYHPVLYVLCDGQG